MSTNERTRESICYAHLHEKEDGSSWFTDFYGNAFATNLCSKERHIVKIRVSKASDPGLDTNYFAWWDNEYNNYHFIYPAKMLVAMCFPYGIEPEIERGRGECDEVELEVLGTFTAKEAAAADTKWKP